MISTKNPTEIMRSKVESILNFVEWPRNNTRFDVKDNLIQRWAKFILQDKYFDQGCTNDFDQKSN